MREERILKILAAVFQSQHRLGKGNQRGVIRSEINSGLMDLNFSAHNKHQMSEDLAILERKGLIIQQPDGNKIRYSITSSGKDLAKSLIEVWKKFRKI